MNGSLGRAREESCDVLPFAGITRIRFKGLPLRRGISAHMGSPRNCRKIRRAARQCQRICAGPETGLRHGHLC
jgi:hypothetical protein